MHFLTKKAAFSFEKRHSEPAKFHFLKKKKTFGAFEKGTIFLKKKIVGPHRRFHILHKKAVRASEKVITS